MKATLSAALVALTLAAAGLLLAPSLLTSPFVAQTEDGIHLAHRLSQWATPTLIGLLAAAALCARLLAQRTTAWWSRALIAVPLLLLVGALYMSRTSMVERMFRPIEEAHFVGAADAEHVADEEMVLGVRLGDEAKAYPVLIVAYHHIVNDRLGGTPIAVTY